MKFTNNQKLNGETACKSLSPKAREYYLNSDVQVYEVTEDESKKYYTSGIVELNNITFNELDKTFTELQEQATED